MLGMLYLNKEGVLFKWSVDWDVVLVIQSLVQYIMTIWMNVIKAQKTVKSFKILKKML